MYYSMKNNSGEMLLTLECIFWSFVLIGGDCISMNCNLFSYRNKLYMRQNMSFIDEQYILFVINILQGTKRPKWSPPKCLHFKMLHCRHHLLWCFRFNKGDILLNRKNIILLAPLSFWWCWRHLYQTEMKITWIIRHEAMNTEWLLSFF